MTDRKVFTLTDEQGRLLEPALQATALAKYSRSPLGAKELLSNLTSEEADKFQDKWVVSYSHSCYDDQTEVYTEDGFQMWSTIYEEWKKTGKCPKLASLNPETEKWDFLQPVKLIGEYYKGPMYQAGNTQIGISVTPNHSMWASKSHSFKERDGKLGSLKFGFHKPEDMYRICFAYQVSSLWEGKKDFATIGDKKMPLEPFLELCGLFCRYGTIAEEGIPVQFYFNHTESPKCLYPKYRVMEEIADHCKKCNLTLVEVGKHDLRIDQEGLVELFREFFNSKGSRVPPKWVMEYDGFTLRKFLYNFCQKFPTMDYENSYVIRHLTEDQLPAFVELTLKVGFYPHIRNFKVRKDGVQTYRINTLIKRDRLAVNRRADVPQDAWVPYEGMVYCAELEKYHTLYIRRNGFALWSGNSVAELTSIPICLEGVSMVASKMLENYPRMGYSEKSTRYQIFSGDSFVTPPGAPTGMKEFASKFYDTYNSLYPRMVKRIAELTGKDLNDPNVLTDRVIKARAFDNLRYLLPAGTGTNLAMVGNLRDIRYLIQDGRGHSNPEIRDIAEDVYKAASEVCPVLVQRAEPSTFEPTVKSVSLEGKVPYDGWYVQLKDWTGFDTDSMRDNAKAFYDMTWEEFSQHMTKRGNQAVPKIFRLPRLSFEIMMDYGAFRDLQRHRRCEQFVEPLTTQYGYLVPDDILGSDLEEEYRAAMEHAKTYSATTDKDLVQYVIPMGYLHRSYFTMDLAQLYYMVELRTKPQGHISYRRVAYEMYLSALEVNPTLMQWCRAVKPESIGAHT